MSELERWIRDTLPLDAAVSEHALREARRRAAELGVLEAGLLDRLRSDPREIDRLLTTVVPPESWLFRHEPAFEAIREWLREHDGRRVRMLSLGCARGAEALSLAAAAMSVGRTPANTTIVGVDWNQSHLQDAAVGSVSPLAQRAPLPGWAERWFEPDERGWLRLRPEPRSMIRWERADIVKDPAPDVADVVMCRNVAIYLGASARATLRERLATVVRPGGLLCLGHADPGMLWEGAFEALARPGGFVFTRREPSATHGTPPVRVTPMPSHESGTAMSTTIVDPARPRCDPSGFPITRPIANPITLAAIQELADAGHLDQAASRLESMVHLDGLQAEAWALLGSVRLAQGRHADAEGCFGKVVYLQPRHALALLQLSGLADRRGDAATADRLRLRAARAAVEESA